MDPIDTLLNDFDSNLSSLTLFVSAARFVRRVCNAPSPKAVGKGLLSEKRVNESARRVLAQKFAAGLFEAPFTDPEAWRGVLDNPKHRALAREV